MYDEDHDLLDDVLIEVRQAIDMSNIYLNIVNGIMDASSSVISNNLSSVMKAFVPFLVLAVIPLIIFGLYGMNVSFIPFANFWFPLILAAGLTAVTFFAMKKKKAL
jgi:magnesium transporter